MLKQLQLYYKNKTKSILMPSSPHTPTKNNFISYIFMPHFWEESQGCINGSTRHMSSEQLCEVV